MSPKRTQGRKAGTVCRAGNYGIVSASGHTLPGLSVPQGWGYFLMSGYPYVRIRPPRGARSFENADIFPPAESGTEQTNIFLQL